MYNKKNGSKENYGLSNDLNNNLLNNNSANDLNNNLLNNNSANDLNNNSVNDLKPNSNNDIFLQTCNLCFSYDDKPVLKNINLSVKRGEKIAVMGSNGAGKSTFFLNLNGVYKPDKGEIFIDGNKIDKKNYNELHRKVGFVFQDADSQLIASNVRAEVSFGPVNMGLSKDEVVKRVDSAIEYMSLENFTDRPPHYLSGGEKKRVSIADILAMDTEVLIFDEPMAALDPVNAENTENILNKLHSDGKTLIVATHDVDFAYRFADRIILFCDGQITADGTVLEIFNKKAEMERAHLKKPVLMNVWESLVKANIVKNTDKYPKTADELDKIINKGGH
jgi:cobalt/nickel transport system ATP-binding protein